MRGRLDYERIGPEHAAELARLMAQPSVLATLRPGETPPGVAENQAFLQAKIDHWREHGFGLWALRDPGSREFLGRGGLQYTVIEGLSVIEAAWAMMPDHWGRGLATELTRTAVQTAFGALALERLVAVALPGNLASRRVMEKSGFTYARKVEHTGLQHVLYVHAG